MKSPFPGMDPYLELHWRDVHHRLISNLSELLNEVMPGDLVARVEERVYVEPEEGTERGVYPDLRVIEHGGPAGDAGTTALLSGPEPVIVHVEDEPATEGYIEIIDAGSGNRVITVVEFLSLSNKLPGEGQELYRRKQGELLQARVNLVEIDLLRTGKHVLSAPLRKFPRSHRTPYKVYIRRGAKPGDAELYRLPLRERLPRIKIPLRETDPDAEIDLQALVDRCYRTGRYHTLDYKRELDPPLAREDAAWADRLLREAGRR